MSKVFNVNRDYKSKVLMLGEPVGILDTINRPFPELWDMYKAGLAQNWSEDEFDFSPCAKEFAKKDDAAEIMLETLSFQTEADSIVANALLPVLAPFITNTELQAAMTFNTYIELVHSASYSEIIRNSFDNPNEVLQYIVENKAAYERLTVVNQTFDKLFELSHKYALGMVTKEEVFPELYLGMVVLYLLERLQFIASFAITFALGEAGLYQPIAMAVRKICSDEVQIHATVDTIVLRELRKYPMYKEMCDNEEFQAKVVALVDTVEQNEMDWTDHLFRGRTLVGVNAEIIKDWVKYNAQVVREELGIPQVKTIKENPIPWVESWISMNTLQAAAQEQDIVAYKMGGIKDDLDGEFDF